jgi:hypothetical protein
LNFESSQQCIARSHDLCTNKPFHWTVTFYFYLWDAKVHFGKKQEHNFIANFIHPACILQRMQSGSASGFWECSLGLLSAVAEILVGRGATAPPPPTFTENWQIFGNFDLKEG